MSTTSASGSAPPTSGQRSAEDPFAQVRIAEAAALIDSAWLALERDMTELMGHATSNEKIPLPLRLRTRRDQGDRHRPGYPRGGPAVSRTPAGGP